MLSVLNRYIQYEYKHSNKCNNVLVIIAQITKVNMMRIYLDIVYVNYVHNTTIIYIFIYSFITKLISILTFIKNNNIFNFT